MKKLIVIAILSIYGISVYGQATVSDKGYLSTGFCCENDVLFTKNMTTLVKFPQNKTISSYTIPSSVQVIAKGAFQGNKYLRTIRIPSSVYFIGDNAFDSCEQLTSIEIYESTSSARAIETDNPPDKASEVGRYNIQGVKIQEDEEGKVQIILYSDGTFQKVIK